MSKKVHSTFSDRFKNLVKQEVEIINVKINVRKTVLDITCKTSFFFQLPFSHVLYQPRFPCPQKFVSGNIHSLSASRSAHNVVFEIEYNQNLFRMESHCHSIIHAVAPVFEVLSRAFKAIKKKIIPVFLSLLQKDYKSSK